MMRSGSLHEQVRWPANRFYWLVIDSCPWRSRGQVPAGVLLEAQDELPAPIDQVHAVAVPLDDGRLVICAVERENLGSISSAALALSPEAIPGELGVVVSTDEFNLLVGDCEPRQVRSARRRKHLFAMAWLVILTALMCFGLSRREAHWRDLAVSTRSAASQTAAAMSASTAADLLGELERLRSLDAALVAASPGIDAPASLAGMLSSWPIHSAQPQSVVVSEDLATLAVALEGDPRLFLQELRPPAGWRMEEPRLSTVKNLTRLTIILRPDSLAKEADR